MNIEEELKQEEEKTLVTTKDMGDDEKRAYKMGYTDAMLYAMETCDELQEQAIPLIRKLTLKMLSRDKRYKGYKGKRYYASHIGEDFRYHKPKLKF